MTYRISGCFAAICYFSVILFCIDLFRKVNSTSMKHFYTGDYGHDYFRLINLKNMNSCGDATHYNLVIVLLGACFLGLKYWLLLVVGITHFITFWQGRTAGKKWLGD